VEGRLRFLRRQGKPKDYDELQVIYKRTFQ
jgi:hypothetical protein